MRFPSNRSRGTNALLDCLAQALVRSRYRPADIYQDLQEGCHQPQGRWPTDPLASTSVPVLKPEQSMFLSREFRGADIRDQVCFASLLDASDRPSFHFGAR